MWGILPLMVASFLSFAVLSTPVKDKFYPVSTVSNFTAASISTGTHQQPLRLLHLCFESRLLPQCINSTTKKASPILRIKCSNPTHHPPGDNHALIWLPRKGQTLLLSFVENTVVSGWLHPEDAHDRNAPDNRSCHAVLRVPSCRKRDQGPDWQPSQLRHCTLVLNHQNSTETWQLFPGNEDFHISPTPPLHPSNPPKSEVQPPISSTTATFSKVDKQSEKGDTKGVPESTSHRNTSKTSPSDELSSFAQIAAGVGTRLLGGSGMTAKAGVEQQSVKLSRFCCLTRVSCGFGGLVAASPGGHVLFGC
jgi:hypothetical protein